MWLSDYWKLKETVTSMVCPAATNGGFVKLPVPEKYLNSWVSGHPAGACGPAGQRLNIVLTVVMPPLFVAFLDPVRRIFDGSAGSPLTVRPVT